MNNAAILDWMGDNAFVLISVLGSVAVIIYLWATFNNRARGR